MTERTSSLESYKRTDSQFVDFRQFQGNHSKRREQRHLFVVGENYVPEYDYPHLDDFSLDSDNQAKKSAIYEAVLALEAAKSEPSANQAELELYASFHELRLKKIMMVEAAEKLRQASTASEREIAAEGFSELNKEVYGEFDTSTYMSMLGTEKSRLTAFEPTTPRAEAIKNQLEMLMTGMETSSFPKEQPLMSDEHLAKLKTTLEERYADVFAVIPNTPDDVYYDAQQCADIMNDALKAGGLWQTGWWTEVNPDKSNPSTDAETLLISLPASTRRNANELKRLIVHEIEVHARRGENGYKVDFDPLIRGTADYADVEEGEGVLFECALAGSWDNPSFHRARDRYITAGLALGHDGTPRDARGVFETLWRMLAIRNAENGIISDKTIEKAQALAYTHVENAFRGTKFWMRGVIYTKLKVYYEGLRKNADYFTQNIDTIDEAIDRSMIGKCDHTNPREYANVTAALEQKAA